MFNELHSLAHTCCSHSVTVCRYYCCYNVFSSWSGGRARPASSVRETTASLGCEGALGPRFVVRAGHVLCAWESVFSAVGECSVYTAGPVRPSGSGRLRLCWFSVRSPHLLRMECQGSQLQRRACLFLFLALAVFASCFFQALLFGEYTVRIILLLIFIFLIQCPANNIGSQ